MGFPTRTENEAGLSRIFASFRKFAGRQPAAGVGRRADALPDGGQWIECEA